MGYGTAAGVASLASVYTDSGAFLDPDVYEEGTIPTLAQVEEWLEQVSAFIDIAFSGEGFTTPISHVEALKAIDLRVNALVADLVKLQHSKGRLFSDRIQETGLDPLTIIEKDVFSWVGKRANAFENMGIPRIVDLESNQAFSIPGTRQK